MMGEKSAVTAVKLKLQADARAAAAKGKADFLAKCSNFQREQKAQIYARNAQARTELQRLKANAMPAKKIGSEALPLQASDNPYISSVGIAPLSQGQTVVIAGKDLGDGPGSVMLKGNFIVNGSSTPLVVELPVTGGIWEDTVIGAGPVPTNLIGFDQDIRIQVRTKGNKLSNEKKVAFVTQREIKLVPPGAMKWSGTGTVAMVEGVTNTIGRIIELEVKWNPNICPAQEYVEPWTTDFKDYQKFHSWVFGHWVGNFPQEPTFSVVNNHVVYQVHYYLEHTTDVLWDSAFGNVYHCICNAGYYVNMYYTTPTGMN
jgi:hypothetical protein